MEDANARLFIPLTTGKSCDRGRPGCRCPPGGPSAAWHSSRCGSCLQLRRFCPCGVSIFAAAELTLHKPVLSCGSAAPQPFVLNRSGRLQSQRPVSKKMHGVVVAALLHLQSRANFTEFKALLEIVWPNGGGECVVFIIGLLVFPQYLTSHCQLT